jgi:hypothetical protein
MPVGRPGRYYGRQLAFCSPAAQQYVILLLRADNNGEGGTLSLTALTLGRRWIANALLSSPKTSIHVSVGIEGFASKLPTSFSEIGKDRPWKSL